MTPPSSSPTGSGFRNDIAAVVIGVVSILGGVPSGHGEESPSPAPGPYTIDTLPVPNEARSQVATLDFAPDGGAVLLARDGLIWRTAPDQEAWQSWSRFGLEGATGLHAGYLPKSLYVVHATGITRLFDTDAEAGADFVKSVIPVWRFGTLGELFRGSPAVLPGGDLLLSPNVVSGSWSGVVMRVPEASPISPWMTGFVKISAPAPGPEGTWVLAGQTPAAKEGEKPVAALWIVPPAEDAPEPPGEKSEADSASEEKENGTEEAATSEEESSPSEAESPPKPDTAPVAGAPSLWLPETLMPTPPIRPAFPMMENAENFGPFSGQGFVAGESSKRLLRLMPEKIGGAWQGAVTDFAAIESPDPGIDFLTFSPDGSQLFAGEGGQVLRIRPAGGHLHAVRKIHLATDGFEVRFTRPLDREKAADPSSWRIVSHRPDRPGGPSTPFDPGTEARVIIDFDAKAATLQFPVDRLEPGTLYAFDLSALTSEQGDPLSHGPVYYTLNALPEVDENRFDPLKTPDPEQPEEAPSGKPRTNDSSEKSDSSEKEKVKEGDRD